MSDSNRLICILGMHRSGTSCVTGSLQQAGLFLGNCHTWNPYNQKGNRENQDFVDLNDSVMAENGGAWDKPPKHVVWSPQSLERARALLAENFGEGTLGFKDPRTLLTVEGWKQVFPAIQFVGVIRNPHAVAQSLQSRSGMSRRKGLSLWHSYNQALLKEYESKAFPILCFDENEQVFHEKLDQVVGGLQLSGAISEQRFYDEQLRTSNKSQPKIWQRLPGKVKRLYDDLLERCL